MKKEKIVVLCSGGFDSIVMLNDLARNPVYDIHVLFFDYGQKNARQEETYTLLWLEKLGLLGKGTTLRLPPFVWCSNSSMVSDNEVEDYESTKAQYVPMRNMIFASYALSYAESIGAGEIYLALLGGGTYPDTTLDFLNCLNEIAYEVGVTFVAPFISHDKVYLYSRAKSYGLISEPWGEQNFFSCNTPVEGKPCGRCADCKIIDEMFNKPLDEC